MQIYARWEELKKAGKDGSNSNVGRYIYIGKGKLRLNFLKHAILRALLQRLRAAEESEEAMQAFASATACSIGSTYTNFIKSRYR